VKEAEGRAKKVNPATLMSCIAASIGQHRFTNRGWKEQTSDQSQGGAELAKALGKTPQATVSFSFLPVSALVALRVMQDGK
jgi:hypothetical protein